jgi:hypothetical protein
MEVGAVLPEVAIRGTDDQECIAMSRNKVGKWSLAALAAVAGLVLSNAESSGQGGGRQGGRQGMMAGGGMGGGQGMGGGMMGGNAMAGGQGMAGGMGGGPGMMAGGGMGGGPGMMGGMQGAGDQAMMARRQMMMNMPMDPLDPAVVLALKDQLGLTPKQVATIQKALATARQQVAAALKPEQKQLLQAAFAGAGGAEMGKPDQPPGQMGGMQKKGMQKGGMRGKPAGDDAGF